MILKIFDLPFSSTSTRQTLYPWHVLFICSLHFNCILSWIDCRSSILWPHYCQSSFTQWQFALYKSLRSAFAWLLPSFLSAPLACRKINYAFELGTGTETDWNWDSVFRWGACAAGSELHWRPLILCVPRERRLYCCCLLLCCCNKAANAAKWLWHLSQELYLALA